VKSAPDNATLAAQSDVIVCCVKPGDAEDALATVRESGAGKTRDFHHGRVTLSRLRDIAAKRRAWSV